MFTVNNHRIVINTADRDNYIPTLLDMAPMLADHRDYMQNLQDTASIVAVKLVYTVVVHRNQCVLLGSSSEHMPGKTWVSNIRHITKTLQMQPTRQ